MVIAWQGMVVLAQNTGLMIDAGLFVALAGLALFAICRNSRRV